MTKADNEEIESDEELEDEAPKSSPWRRLLHFPFPSIFALIILLSANSLIALPYSVLSPGQATSVTGFIEIGGDTNFEHEGNVLFTTVNVKQTAHPFDVFWSWIFPGQELEKSERVVGNSTPEEYIQQNEAAMDASKLAAITVAMNRAGFQVTSTGRGARVQQLVEDSPASGVIKPGEVIQAVNGQPIELADDLTKYIQSVAPGTELTMSVMGAEEQVRDVKIATIARPDDANVSLLGVVITTYDEGVDTPFPVSINTERIGGPSAGLAFTLALLDQLTPGDLTGGNDIAVTGTINRDASVGPVGGVKQKAKAVSKTKAKLFLVPSDEYEDALAGVDDDVIVERVDTLQEALDALGRNGGDLSGLPPAPVSSAA